jgi:hypothetical protein
MEHYEEHANEKMRCYECRFLVDIIVKTLKYEISLFKKHISLRIIILKRSLIVTSQIFHALHSEICKVELKHCKK